MRRAWIDGEADGAKAKVVMTDGRTEAQPERAVLVPRVMREIDAAVIEDALEDYARCFPAAEALERIGADIESAAGPLCDRLERIWLSSLAE